MIKTHVFIEILKPNRFFGFNIKILGFTLMIGMVLLYLALLLLPIIFLIFSLIICIGGAFVSAGYLSHKEYYYFEKVKCTNLYKGKQERVIR